MLKQSSYRRRLESNSACKRGMDGGIDDAIDVCVWGGQTAKESNYCHNKYREQFLLNETDAGSTFMGGGVKVEQTLRQQGEKRVLQVRYEETMSNQDLSR